MSGPSNGSTTSLEKDRTIKTWQKIRQSNHWILCISFRQML